MTTVCRNHRRCVSKLLAGDIKRVPQMVEMEPIGYYIGCPSCGFPRAVLTDETLIVETDGKLTTGPVRCDKCLRTYQIRDDQIEVVP
jgi:hypothetical protein